MEQEQRRGGDVPCMLSALRMTQSVKGDLVSTGQSIVPWGVASDPPFWSCLGKVLLKSASP